MAGIVCKVVLFVALLVPTASPVLAQRNPRATSKLDVAGKFIMVEYGRPSLKGRDVLAMVEPGKVWRMGADKSTTFTSNARVSFGKVTIPEGSYSLWLKKISDNSFELVFNKKSGQWGTERESIDDLASVPMSFSEGTQSVELFTINLNKGAKGNSGELELLWGKPVMKASFTVK
jgi:hypothetical protein